MNFTKPIILQLFTTLAVLGALSGAGCKGDEHARHEHEALPAGEAAEASLYELPTRLRATDGKEFQLAELRGKISVASMIYTRCGTICPRVIADMKRIQSELDSADRERVNFFVVSMDETDAPETLKAYMQRNELDSHWRAYAADAGAAREFAAALGYQFRRTPDGHFVHSNAIYLLDANGAVLKQSPTGPAIAGEFAAAIRDL
jgi:protein SCO1